MKFLIRDKFIKSVPEKEKNNIYSKLDFFYKRFREQNYLLKEIPKGFFLKKIRGIENLYELRITNGDRAFFSINESKKERESNITFLMFSSHDMAIKKVKRLKNISNIEINQDILEVEEEVLKEYRQDYNNVITYEVLDDENLKKYINDEKYYYYLNDEQYQCLLKPLPLFLTGSAGSGKSTLTLRKILNIEEYQESYMAKKIIYFTSNRYLKDSIEKQYNLFRNPVVKSITTFSTLEDFYIKKLQLKSINIAKYNDFKSFIKFSFPNYRKYGFEIEEIYSEIVGIIKGLMIDGENYNWSRNLEKNLISLEGYLKLNSKFSVLNIEDKIQIYNIAEKYQEWLKQNNKYDFIDLSRECFFKKDEIFEYLIVDEIQDLTEIEIYFLLSLVKNKDQVLFAGDIHQMIHSSYFSFERLRNYFYELKLRTDIEMLQKNYRSCKKIVELANYFTELRGEYIGNLGIKDYKEKFLIEEGEIILSSLDLEIIKEAQKDVSVGIVVPNEEIREKLYESLETKHRIFTINEIKGLEYKSIICYNLTSIYKKQWDEILSKKKKQDQRYRKYFNIFYVGITRAREQLIIMEDEISNNNILKKIETFFIKKEEKETKKIIKTQISSKKMWFEEGEKLYKLEKYDEAQYAFEQAGEPTLIKEREIENDILNFEFEIALLKIKKYNLEKKLATYRRKIIDTAINGKKYIEALKRNEEFQISYREKEIKNLIKNLIENSNISQKDIKYLLNFYKNKKDYLFVGDLYILLKKYEEALKYFENINNKKGIQKIREILLTDKFSNIENFDSRFIKVNNLIGEKGINSFGKDRYTPIQRSLFLQNDIIIFNMILELGGDCMTLVKGKNTLIEEIPLLTNYSNNEKIKIIKLIKEKVKNESDLNKIDLLLVETVIKNNCLDFIEDLEEINLAKDLILQSAFDNLNVKVIKYLIKNKKYIVNEKIKLDELYIKSSVKKIEIKKKIILNIIKNSKKIIGGY
ncbi:AAA family ATPase [Cetobacterium sp.]|uniref:AAA family ATPase n=1 Tax=Cetobacterium sp. TaxID=2071632 RepID=UPI003F3FE32F